MCSTGPTEYLFCGQYWRSSRCRFLPAELSVVFWPVTSWPQPRPPPGSWLTLEHRTEAIRPSVNRSFTETHLVQVGPRFGSPHWPRAAVCQVLLSQLGCVAGGRRSWRTPLERRWHQLRQCGSTRTVPNVMAQNQGFRDGGVSGHIIPDSPAALGSSEGGGPWSAAGRGPGGVPGSACVPGDVGGFVSFLWAEWPLEADDDQGRRTEYSSLADMVEAWWKDCFDCDGDFLPPGGDVLRPRGLCSESGSRSREPQDRARLLGSSLFRRWRPGSLLVPEKNTGQEMKCCTFRVINIYRYFLYKITLRLNSKIILASSV